MKKNKMVLLTFVLFTSILTPLFVTPARAQDGHTGGGSFSESDIQSYLNKVNQFLKTKRGQAAFPKIADYNRTHAIQFYDLMATVTPSIVKGPVYDDQKEERDCVSHIDATPPYFECNRARIPQHTFYNEPSLVRMVTHEMFVIARIEKPLSDKIRSVYPYSSKITDYLNPSEMKIWTFATTKMNSKMSAGQLVAFTAAAQGVVLVDAATDEHIAMIRGNRDGTSVAQRQQKLREPFLFDSIAQLFSDTDLDVAYTIVSGNSRGIEIFANDNSNLIHRENLDMNSKEDWISGMNALQPTHLDAHTSIQIIQTLHFTLSEYTEDLEILAQLANGLPGKIVMLENEKFEQVRYLLAKIGDPASTLDNLDLDSNQQGNQ
jgi:hypothetical protein